MVISDLHLGYEAVLEGQGVSIPRLQTRMLRDYVRQILESYAPSKLIIAGDLKHNFSRNLSQEWNDVVRFVEDVKASVPMEVVRGNHDNYLLSILREHDVPFLREAQTSGVRIIHGHEGSHDGRPTVMGHIHPSISVHDESMAKAKSPCFLYDAKSELLVLPALSILADGVDVVREVELGRMSPILPGISSGVLMPIVVSEGSVLKFPKLREIRAGKEFR
jgi:putative SbcD/Mre11-related phosphoesterase